MKPVLVNAAGVHIIKPSTAANAEPLPDWINSFLSSTTIPIMSFASPAYNFTDRTLTVRIINA